MARAREWDVVVVGGANFDYLVRGPKLPRPGETLQGDDLMEGPGGKGANQAAAAARLGARTALVARIGNDDRGVKFAAQLEGEGVDIRHLIHDRQALTGIALVMGDHSGEKQILVAPGPNSRLSIKAGDAAKPVIASSRVVLLQLEIPVESVMEAARLAAESEAQVILDPSPAVPLPDELLRLVDVIRPNAAEAEVLTGIRPKDRNSARAAGERLVRRGVRVAAVQAGGDGNLLVWQDGEHWEPIILGDAVDSTGAGDAFAAGLAVALAEGRSLREAGAMASAAAALATTALGAMPSLPMRSAVNELLAQAGAAIRT